MNLISIDSVSKAVNEITLFSSVSFGIDEGEHIGFVGPNGSGKSTFLKLLTGETPCDSGSIARNRDVRISVLPQRPSFTKDMTVSEFLYAADDPLLRLAGEYERALENVDISHRNASGISHAEKELTRLTHLMEKHNGFGIEHTYRSLLNELGITDFDACMREFSGGMVKKAALARAFTSSAELLLLDEPTNHLDIESIEWLEKKLTGRSGSFILVTHDRYFLDRACTVMLDIDSQDIRKYEGNFSTYLERKKERDEEMLRHDVRRDAILRVELEWLKRGPKARALKDSHRKERALTMLQERREAENTMEGFSLGQKRLGGKILTLDAVSKAWGDHTVLHDFSYSFSKGERIGIIGPNGSGKSTFLDIIAGRTTCDSGTIDFGLNTAIAYFDQTARQLPLEQTVVDFMRSCAERVTLKDGVSISIEQFLERFLFPRRLFFTPLSYISGGELRRLQLIELLARESNFLLFDEPTNDFDIQTISLLEDFLQDFGGCTLLVSHDRAFLDTVVDSLFIFDGVGGVKRFTGSYSQYCALRDEEDNTISENEHEKSNRVVQSEATSAQFSSSSCDAPLTKKKKLSFKEQKEFDALLDEIDALENEKTTLEVLFTAASGDMLEATKRYNAIGALITEKTLRWEVLSDVLT